MPILYVETNFLMSIATGRDAEASDLLVNTPPSLQIAIPSICCMEALSAFEDERKRRNRFKNELNLQISQLRRDLTSASASSLLFLLEESLNENEGLLNDIQGRLFDALDRVATTVEAIELTGEILQESLRRAIVVEDPTDNLILHSILNHARSLPTEAKVFLSGNTSDFGRQTVLEALRDAGVDNYFNSSENFLGWLSSQSLS